ncbi:MAG: TVP38/TMEM64 family protein [Candidatus Moranbacteria bacterium]|nr:TVP38/TMEM64 family protein [Candidatus Moranbacteria bacterium]
MNNKKESIKIVASVLWLGALVVLGAWFWFSNVPVAQVNKDIGRLVAHAGLWGPLVYILIYTVRGFTFFSATVFTFIGGLLFGPVWGGVWATVAANISANVAFMTGKYIGTDAFHFVRKNIKIFPTDEKIRQNGFITILVMRLLYFPYDPLGYISGASGMRQRDFAFATFLGILPGTVAFVYLGASFTDPRNLGIVLIFIMLGIAISRVLKKRTKVGAELAQKKENNKNSNTQEKVT